MAYGHGSNYRNYEKAKAAKLARKPAAKLNINGEAAAAGESAGNGVAAVAASVSQ
jgi:hypothetical protein